MKKKTHSQFKPNPYSSDELDGLKRTHTSQEIRKIWKEAYPKLSESVPESIFKLPREEMLEKARIIINNHFLKNYQTHNEIMADKTTGSAMIGFMMCWNWMKSE